MRSETKQAEPAHPSPSRWGHLLQAISLTVLVLIIAMRPLVSETYDTAVHAMEAAIGDAGSTSPAMTIGFDLAILICGITAVAGMLLNRQSWRWTGLEIGWGLMGLAAISSTLIASNRRLAANASADWLITALLAMILPQLLRERRRIALVLIVIVASGLASVAKDVMQITSEFPDTRAMYQEHKATFWARQNIPLDDPRVELYERRMRGTAASGFFPHSNVQAGLLILCGFAALGLAAMYQPVALVRGISLAAGVTLIAATALTASKGGVSAALIGVVLCLLAWRWSPMLLKHARRLAELLPFIALAIPIAIVSLGKLRGGLPGSSLQFRWEYWNVTWELIRNHLWRGVGALNFDRSYLGYKPIQYPEEIKDPHNFLLSLWAQWGILGMAGLVTMLVMGTRRSLRNVADDSSVAEATSVSSGAVTPQAASTAGTRAIWAATLVIGFISLRLLTLSDYLTSADPGARAMVVFDLGLYGLLWCLIAGSLMWVVLVETPQSSHSFLTSLVLFCGLVAFLLHNLIEFSIFYPATLTVFAAMAGVLLSQCEAPLKTVRTEKAARRYAPLAILALAGFIFCTTVAVPVLRAGELLTRARTATTLETAESAYRLAAESDTWDPTPLTEKAGVYALTGRPSSAAESLRLASQRDPLDANLHRLLARALQEQYEQSHDAHNLLTAIEELRVSSRLYPASPDERVNLADVLLLAASQIPKGNFAQEASHEYQQGLDLDAARPGTDEVRRWSPTRRADITARLNRAKQATSQPSTAPGA